MFGSRWTLAPLLLVLLWLLLLPGSATAAETFDSFTKSTSHHRYEVYLGSVDLLRPGTSAPYLSKSAFESEIRFDQQAVDQIAAALPADSGFSQGIATAAPDGGSWITGALRPGWWVRPNGGAEDSPLFDAQGRFEAAPQGLLAPGETAICTDSPISETVLQDDELTPTGALPYATTTVVTFGPDTVRIGKDRSEVHTVVSGETNYNTETSFLTLAVHRLKRTCVVSTDMTPPPPPDRCAMTSGAKDSDRDGIADACDEDPSLPDSCTLRVARSRVFVYKSKPKARLVVKYKTSSPAEVRTTYTAKLANGSTLVLGSLKQRFKDQGTFKLPVPLAGDLAAKVRAAKSFSVSFQIPGAPKACARAYAKALTKKQQVAKQTVWFQADAVLGGIF